MYNTKIAIVGGGLSGLYAAWRLEQLGISDWVLLESRDRLGGRILSLPSARSAPASTHPPQGTPRFDLGPSWFWPGYQPQLAGLITELGLERYPQAERGDLLVERAPNTSAVRMAGYESAPPAMRLHGGMAALSDAIAQRLNPARIVKGHTVHRLALEGSGIAITGRAIDGHLTTGRAEQVLLALPPRLVMANIEFAPALPCHLAAQWQRTATWMAPHAKYFAIYDRPFWRAEGLSGSARSAIGPLAEIHDASVPDGPAALFGFVGLPVAMRQRLGEETLWMHCRAQLGRLFGPEASTPIDELYTDWALDPATAVAADTNAAPAHPEPPVATPQVGEWRGLLTGIGSEWSREFPGYLAGAVDAVERGVRDVLLPR